MNLAELSARTQDAVHVAGACFDHAADIAEKMREAFVQGDEYLELVFPGGRKYLITRDVNVYSVFEMTRDGLCPVIL